MGWERTLVLEDDVGLPAHFHAQLRRRLASLPRGWLILNFDRLQCGTRNGR